MFKKLFQKNHKKKKTWKNVAIWLVAVVAFVIVGNVVERFLDNYYHNITTDNSGVEYTMGNVSGNTYVNEWAEISVTFPAEYVEATQEVYEANETYNTDCCLYFTSLTGNAFIILVEDVSLAPSVDEEEYCELFIENMEEAMEQYGAYSPEFTILEEGSEMEIAGHIYCCASIKMTLQAENVSNSVIENVYVRRIGTRMMAIMIASQNEEEVEEMVSFIQPSKDE